MAAMISASVAPLVRLSIAMTSAFLLLRSAFCLPFFLARATFFGVLAFFLACLAFGSDAPVGAAFCCSIVLFIVFLLNRVTVVTIDHSGEEKLQAESAAIRPTGLTRMHNTGIGDQVPFLCGRQNTQREVPFLWARQNARERENATPSLLPLRASFATEVIAALIA